jgi:SAM-dependent methyltransferase
MPFADSSFDGIWSIWVLEHIPEPERALREMRRVLKPGGVLLLAVAWNCAPWGADGFDARPYSDFNWRGKLVKASIPMRTSPYFVMSYGLPTRGIRWLHYQLSGQSTRLRFRRLEPNYDIYWQSDSDAAVSLGRYETYLWFRARGDECLNCSVERSHQLELRIWK